MKAKKSMYSKIRKGSTITAVVSIILVIASLSIAFERFGGEFIWSAQESFNLYDKYFTLAMDKNIQSIKQGFMKTAAFFSLNTVSKELTEHGGHTEAMLVDSDDNKVADLTESTDPEIRIKQDLYSTENIPFWTIPDVAPNCGTTLKRVPYLKDIDIYLPAGNKHIVLMHNDADHMQYINEVNAGKYPLYVSIQLFMLKPGTVEITCEPVRGCLSMNTVGSTPDIIEKDGIYTYKITGIDATKTTTSLHITAKNETGEIDKVARVKQVIVSIYNPGILGSTTPNELYTEKLENYYNSMNTILDKRNEKGDIQMSIAPLKGTITRGYESYVEGTVWPDENQDGITAYMDDLFFEDRKLAELRDSGLVTEETKIRYYKLYTQAEKFTNNAQQLFQSRLWDMLHNLDLHGYSIRSRTACGVPLTSCGIVLPCSGDRYCKEDQVASYTKDNIHAAIAGTLAQIESECNTETSVDGITWHIEYPIEFFADFPRVTNRDKDACDAPEHFKTDNIEYVEYIKKTFKFVGVSTWCDCHQICRRHGNCCHGCTRYCYRNKCEMIYDRRYILKNLKIYVTITDNNYKIYDANSNTWEKLVFKYYIAIPIVDMNCGGGDATSGHDCKDHTTHCTNPYGIIHAADIFAPVGPLKIISDDKIIADSSAAITWTTNKPATSKVKYSTTLGGPYIEISDSTKVSGHIITIENINPETTYYYIIESTSGSETAISPDSPPDHEFTTNADETDPEIRFTSPTSTALESTMGPVIYLEADASDNDAIDEVKFYFYDDTGRKEITSLTVPPYSHTVDIRDLVANPSNFAGGYLIEAKATDKSGRTGFDNILVHVAEIPDNIEITNVDISTTSYTATANWTTLQITAGTFEYCLDEVCSSADFEDLRIAPDEPGAYDGAEAGLANYRIHIPILEPGTTYAYTIAVNVAGAETSTISPGTFTTLMPPPVISGIVEYITYTAATISWNTDVDADCHLDYGIAPSHVDVGSADSSGIIHNIGLTSLTPGVTYNYEITCVHVSGSDLTTETGVFTTLIPPPTISNIQATGITDTTATITWNTNPDSACHLDYGTPPGLDSTGTLHNIGLTSLTPGVTYNYGITCTQVGGSESATVTGGFTTASS
ncbi:MAG: hypothetical protein DRN71_01615 [Candidatus Nanohalarchaeota archaeon]|nr:MAG: hypothetical protein DRN71_01615 [Candidatus Nanohaloarchaeota archaeon]